MDIISKLNNLGDDVLEQYPSLNYGGCMVYAAMIVAALKKHGINAKGIVVSYYGSGTNISEARKNIKKNTIHEWQENGINFYHVGVEFSIEDSKKHYDSHGVVEASDSFAGLPIYEGRMEYIELRALAAKKDGWNPDFKRKNIPALRRLVKHHLAVDTAPVAV